MATLTMTLYGANKYLLNQNRSIFERLTLPPGIDKDLFIDRLILRSGEFEILYSDLDFLVEAIGVWGKAWEKTFTKWVKALSIEYNPLENYDRIEDWTTTDEYENHSKDRGFSDNTTQNDVSAFDSSGYQPNSKDSTHYAPNLDNDANGKNTNTREGRAHGNIGVTTSQQMLSSKLSIAEWNLYDHMADLFIKEFCICVY